MKTSSITMLLSFGLFIASTAHAWTYTFTNKSEIDAEVQFKLAADMTTNYKTETLKVSANKSESFTAPEWYRVGLCIDLPSITIRFLPNGTFKRPYVLCCNDGSRFRGVFDHIVRTKK